MNHNGGYDGQYIVIAVEESLSPNLPIAGHSTTTFATENHQSKAAMQTFYLKHVWIAKPFCVQAIIKHGQDTYK